MHRTADEVLIPASLEVDWCIALVVFVAVKGGRTDTIEKSGGVNTAVRLDFHSWVAVEAAVQVRIGAEEGCDGMVGPMYLLDEASTAKCSFVFALLVDIRYKLDDVALKTSELESATDIDSR